MSLVERFARLPVVGIVRGVESGALPLLAESAVHAGLEFIEITLNTPNPYQKIGELRRLGGASLIVGAGTVLTTEELTRSLDVGAQFIVSPVLVPEVVERCVALGIPVFPGAFTPQEVFQAFRAGATMVKLFPAQLHGPAYFRELRGPFQNIPLLACGGVRVSNIREYFESGAQAVAVGGSIFARALKSDGDFPALRRELTEVVQAVRSVRFGGRSPQSS